MATQLTDDDARQSLTAHVESKGVDVLTRYGLISGPEGLEPLLADRTQVRYPCRVVFDHTPLQAGEFAHAEPQGPLPEDGFTIYVHPAFLTDPARVPALVLYQLVAVNYGEFASAHDAETFGAAALGLTRDEYYALLCESADRVSPPGFEPAEAPVTARTGCGGGGEGCTCGSGQHHEAH